MPAEADSVLSLDAVRARIFYLASDVEPVSPPAAMLLRAVADAIEEGESERFGDIGSDRLASALAEVTNIRQFASGAASAVGRPLEIVASRPGNKV